MLMIGSEAPGISVIARARHCDDDKASQTLEEDNVDYQQCIYYNISNRRTQGRANTMAGTGRAQSRLASTAFPERLNTLLNLLAHVVVAAVAPSWPHR